MTKGDVNSAVGSAPRGWRQHLDLVATIIMILAGMTILVVAVRGAFAGPGRSATASRTVPVPKDPVSIEGAPRRGGATARVAFIEHSDFQCPYCGKFERETLPELTKQYVDSGRVLFVFRDALIPSHPQARPAAEAASCAQAQGQFWAAHDLFFGAQDKLHETIATLPAALHLAAQPYAACLAKDAPARVDADVALDRTLSVTGTPAFFVGVVQSDGRVQVKRTLTGALPLKDFQDAIDAVLKSAPAATTAATR